MYPLLRLLLPGVSQKEFLSVNGAHLSRPEAHLATAQSDHKRSTFKMQETGLANVLVKALDLALGGYDASRLEHWDNAPNKDVSDRLSVSSNLSLTL